MKAAAIDIEANIEQVKVRIARACQRVGRSPDEVTIVAVTKNVEPSAIATAFELGIRHFGENRVQEAVDKLGQLSGLKPHPTWHMVGHLQTNKVKVAVEIFDIIHSIDSVRLAEVISRRTQRTLPVLLEVNVSGEASKSGFSVAEVEPALEAISHLPRLEMKGLMTIAPIVVDAEQARPVFRKLCSLRDCFGLEHLSMGMSDDFEVAVEEGATMLRIGRAIFGERRT
ncbi:MAG: YggS family pyridoxal phosphate-dependent enzyme [Dehalococcoidales bacterium]|nr:YggS family pyridoxal phosphate-dependent enzyme [Dehalococcoidales bacterium]